MPKRIIDLLAAAAGLVLLSPVLALVLLLVWLQDFHSPLYIAERVARGGGSFRMIKVRSMVVRADRSGVESTSANDPRITAVGHVVRRWKVDELSQLWNVLVGDMSLVGPRPNTPREVDQYTPAERELLSVKPGITDISSIVFSDEGEILRDAEDPDRAYAELIRPWKSRLGLLYVRHSSVALDLRLIWLTVVAIFDRPRALAAVERILGELRAETSLQEVARRESPLRPAPLP
jgi:lipopolysaccharide/colanic/teichoic acid biosynthesis glycosyltransferase